MIRKKFKLFLKVATLFLSVSKVSFPEIASYYAKPFHGRITYYGIAYDMNELTCASNKYEKGTTLLVTNKRNNKKVNVIVTDTGSFTKKYGRDIDLSKEAFSRLDKLGYGLLNVKIEVLKLKPFELLIQQRRLNYEQRNISFSRVFQSNNIN